MKEQKKIPVTRTGRSVKFVQTGARIGVNYLRHYSRKVFQPELTPDELKQTLDEENAADIYDSLSELKGSALKVAQMLSMDRNLLPKAYATQFSLSQYNAPPLSGPLIIQTFTRHLGKTPGELFDNFNLKSSHAASIGQVHEAWLNGKKLAVKIQYPGVGDSISSDLKMVKPLAFRLLEMNAKDLEIYMAEVESKMLEETDYELEIRRSVVISEACRHIKDIQFPVYYPELSSKRVITMDWLEGKHLKEYLETKPSQQERNRIGQTLWDFYNFQQHRLKLVHADPHPGNFLILDNGKLGIIDFGCIKEIPESFYTPFFTLIHQNALDNREESLQCFRELEMIHAQDTPKQIEFYYRHYYDMISLFRKPYRQPEFDFANDEFLNDIFTYGEKISGMPEFKQARGVSHFIYINRTNFGLYSILNTLGAKVRTDTYKPLLANG